MSESLPPNLMSCAQCDAELPADGTNGLCPACLMAEAMKPSGPKARWEPPTAEELAPHFPPYEIQRILGRGGMGAVYLARQISLNRLVAIKILPVDLGDCDMGFAERFKNEAQAMAQLSHPGIVAVFDFGETANGLLYIVMEFIEGTDVQQMVAQQGRLHSAHAMAITAHVCDALAYAHSRGIIHRDIKPSNIMVSSEGVVKVADFGLAKMDQGGQTASLTQSGMAMGTLHFMAPEALTLGTAVDQRADIYAVGVMLYQMLTGKLPQGMFEMPSLQVPGLDPRYDGIVAKALREDRAVRYQQAAELRQDLDAILTQPVVKVEPEQAPAAMPPPAAKPERPAGQSYRPPQRSAPPPPKKKSHTKLIFGGLALLVLIAAWVFLFVGGRTTTQPALASKTQPFVNSLGMKFVPVPGTNVLICIHETRMQDYAAFARAEKVDGSWQTGKKDDVLVAVGPDYPVRNVNWDDANRYCLWLTQNETEKGSLPQGLKYRLPGDGEWSRAAGLDSEVGMTITMKSGRETVTFPWGTSFPPEPGSGNYADMSFHKAFPDPKEKWLEGYDDTFPTTAPVMSFRPNALGIYDLGGNVDEWCEEAMSKRTHLTRGGSWGTSGRENMLASHRGAGWTRHPVHGFRCVIELSTTGTTATPPASAAIPTATLITPEALPSLGTPRLATKEQPFVNSLGMKFVPVPRTEVLFCIHETRYQDYAAYAAKVAGVNNQWKNQTLDGIEITQRASEHPVVQVNCFDAQNFCAWLSQKEGRIYRLPTDQEWSFAAGIGGDEMTPANSSSSVAKNEIDFPWGKQWPPPPGSGNYSDESRKAKAPGASPLYLGNYDDGFPTTAPVMTFKSNQLGIFDLNGNVWEWCGDRAATSLSEFVLRGASYDRAVRGELLSTYRIRNSRVGRGRGGFRVVLEMGSAPREASPGTPTSTITSAAPTTGITLPPP